MTPLLEDRKIVARPDQPYSAPYLAERLKEMYDSEGFKIWWGQYEREMKRTEKWVMTSPMLENAEKTAMELSKRQGFLLGLRQMATMTEELLEELQKGNVPWRAK